MSLPPPPPRAVLTGVHIMHPRFGWGGDQSKPNPQEGAKGPNQGDGAARAAERIQQATCFAALTLSLSLSLSLSHSLSAGGHGVYSTGNLRCFSFWGGHGAYSTGNLFCLSLSLSLSLSLLGGTEQE